MTSLRQALDQAIKYTVLDPARQEPRLLLLSLSTMLITMGQGIVSPILPLMVQSFGMTAAMVGFAVSAFAVARVFTNIPAGLLTRRKGVRFVLVSGAFCAAVGNLFIALIPAYLPLIVFRFIAGLGSAMYITAAVVFVAEVSTPENRGRFMTIYQTAFLMGFTLGPSMGGIAAALFGLSAPFVLVAAVSATAGIWVLARIPADIGLVSGQSDKSGRVAQQGAINERQKTTSILLNPSFIAVNLIALGIFFTRGGALFTLWPLLGKERFTLDPGRLGLLLTVAAAANLICQPSVATLIDRVGQKTLLIPATFLFALSTLVSAISPTIWLFALALVLYGVGQAFESPSANSYVSDLAPREQRAVALSIHRTFGDVGLVIGSPLLGFIADMAGIPWALVVNAGLVAIPGILFIFLAQETAGRRQASVSP